MWNGGALWFDLYFNGYLIFSPGKSLLGSKMLPLLCSSRWGRGYSELKFRLIELYREQGMDLAWEIGVLIHSIRYALKVALILAALYAIDLAYRSFAVSLLALLIEMLLRP